MKPEPDRSLVGADLRGQDLRRFDFRDKILFRADLREANLHGASITIDCQTFDGVKLDNYQVATLVMMLAQADIDPRVQHELLDTARVAVGENDFHVLQRVLRVI